jgi:hypothetical protein
VSIVAGEVSEEGMAMLAVMRAEPADFISLETMDWSDHEPS